VATIDQHSSDPKSPERVDVIDVIGHDPKTDEAVLIMNELRPWDGSDARLHQLQERFNTYASFLLDGEFGECHPQLAAKPVRIDVRCTHMPDPRALDLLGAIHDQLALQEIKMEVIVREND
jgi:hypothetical protein